MVCKLRRSVGYAHAEEKRFHKIRGEQWLVVLLRWVRVCRRDQANGRPSTGKRIFTRHGQDGRGQAGAQTAKMNHSFAPNAGLDAATLYGTSGRLAADISREEQMPWLLD